MKIGICRFQRKFKKKPKTVQEELHRRSKKSLIRFHESSTEEFQETFQRELMNFRRNRSPVETSNKFKKVPEGAIEQVAVSAEMGLGATESSNWKCLPVVQLKNMRSREQKRSLN